MQDNVVLSDGHTHNDLLAITVDKMQEFLHEKKEEDFYKLFELTLARLEKKTEPQAAPAEAVKVVQTEEMFITHNGKTYKLTEVTTPQPEVAANAPLYTQGPKAPESAAPVKRTRAVRGGAKAKAK